MVIIDTELATFKGWLARDMNGSLHFFKSRPILDFQIWYAPGVSFLIPKDRFPNIKYEDSPIRVELMIRQFDENIAKRDAIIKRLNDPKAFIDRDYSTDDLIAWIKNLVPETDINAPTKV